MYAFAHRLLRGAAIGAMAAALTAALLLSMPQGAGAQDSAPFPPQDKAAFDAMIRDYLLEHPEVVVEALESFQRREQARATERQTQTLQSADLRYDPESPVIGNPDGDVVIVEFFDYRCPYCKQVTEPLLEVVKEDGNIRLVMKELPILSAESYLAARAALAAEKQGRYEDFHFALMTEPGTLSEASIFAVAKDLDLDLERLRRDMDSPEVAAALDDVSELADRLGIRGTPAFVIGDEIIPGALSIDAMRQRVAEARAG
ncbi:MAG: DsbA family protein, partial [Rhodovibrionaceae bacterium]